MVDKTEQETLKPVANDVASDVMYDVTTWHNANQNMLWMEEMFSWNTQIITSYNHMI